uniref:Uncharacterized protein n=1 Tax=Panagrolaimus superbus TaxID=310955 RepID=A0A914YBZ1_9BILA
MSSTEWYNNDEYIETYPTTTTNFQYINEDTCTSTTTTTTADNSTIRCISGDEDTAEHAEMILNYFQQLYYSQKGIDLEIFVDGISVAKVHRIIIASFLRLLDPIIDGNNSASSLIKLEVPNSISVSIDDLREIINFLYTGKIVIKNKSILKALDKLGCNHILPLLYDVLDDGKDEETLVEDKYHSINLMNKLIEFCDEKRFIDCSLRLEHGIEVKCHRYCIAAFSKIVEQSLQEVENTQIVYLEITELENASSIKAVNQLVTFIYSNIIPTDINEFDKLKETASIFGVERLVKKLPTTTPTIAATHIETYESIEEEYSEESTSYFGDQDSNSASESAILSSNTNLTAESEYVNIYNQYVDGPMTASCSDYVYDPTVEYLTTTPTKSVKTRVSKILRYKCPLCTFASPNRGTIRKHIRSIHTHETPYSCPQCFMAFKVQSNLARHLRSHSQIKPYKCKSCGSEYADKKNMDAHIFREHLKREPFRCPHNCVKAKFYREDSWRRHCQKFHSNLSEISFPDLIEDGMN